MGTGAVASGAGGQRGASAAANRVQRVRRRVTACSKSIASPSSSASRRRQTLILAAPRPGTSADSTDSFVYSRQMGPGADSRPSNRTRTPNARYAGRGGRVGKAGGQLPVASCEQGASRLSLARSLRMKRARVGAKFRSDGICLMLGCPDSDSSSRRVSPRHQRQRDNVRPTAKRTWE